MLPWKFTYIWVFVVVATEMIDVECASDCASDVDSGCDDDAGHLS